MLDNMSTIDFMRWRVWMRLSPSIEEMMPYLGALGAQASWNVQIAKSKSDKNPQPIFRQLSEFVIPFGDMPDPRAAPKQTPEEKIAADRSRWESMKLYLLSIAKKKQ